MKVLAVGLDETTLTFLKTQGIISEVTDDIDDADALADWLRGGDFAAAVVHFEGSSLGIYAPRVVRARGITSPVIGISKGSEEYKWSDYRALFLESGGDDLLRGPTNPRELAASLRAATRRFKGGLHDTVECCIDDAKLRINLTTGFVSVNEVRVHLTYSELSTLVVLAEAPGRVLAKENLMAGLYTGSIDEEPEMKIIDVFVCKLRKKLAEAHPMADGFVETVWGRGYMLAGYSSAGAERRVA